MTRPKKAPDGARIVAGIPVFLETSHTLPLVDVEVIVRSGALLDPIGKEGVARLVGRMCRMGTKKLRGHEVEEAISALGGRLSVEVSTMSTRFHGTVIRKNLAPFLELLASLLVRPAMRVHDLEHVKREAEADRVAMLDNDRVLASRHFRRALFREHVYGRALSGTRASHREIERSDLVAFHAATYVRSNLLVGAAGDVDEATFARLVERAFADVPECTPLRPKVAPTKQRRGIHLRIVDKPKRTQTQILVGTLGSKLRDPLTFPLLVANTAFGGMFTGKLMHEIRTVRGYSYGASSRLAQDVARDAWSMHTFPSAKDTAASVALMLKLERDFATKGPSTRSLVAAKRYLANSRCFEEDTAPKRLDAKLDAVLYGLPSDHFTRFAEHVRAVDPEVAREAVRSRLSPDNLEVVVVATAAEVQSALAAAHPFTSIEVVPYDSEL